MQHAQSIMARSDLFLFFVPPPVKSLGLHRVFGGVISHLMGSALEDYWGVFRYNLFSFLLAGR